MLLMMIRRVHAPPSAPGLVATSSRHYLDAALVLRIPILSLQLTLPGLPDEVVWPWPASSIPL